jgi:prevent-host-death family protein
MAQYSIQEAAAKLEEILQKVRGGEKIILTDNGADIAEVRPIRPEGEHWRSAGGCVLATGG